MMRASTGRLFSAIPGLAMALLLHQPASAAGFDYATCVDLATVDPEATANEALRWWEQTGDLGARHCQAIALSEFGAKREAAKILHEIVIAPDMEDGVRTLILLQAARLWRSLGEDDNARSALDSALRIKADVPVLIDRAALRADQRDFEGAEADLSRALSSDPRNEEALTLRAAARRKLGNAQGALADATQAIDTNPVSPSAWLEFGNAEFALGRKDGARRAWLKAIDVAPGAPSAALARGALQDMDGGG